MQCSTPTLRQNSLKVGEAQYTKTHGTCLFCLIGAKPKMVIITFGKLAYGSTRPQGAMFAYSVFQVTA